MDKMRALLKSKDNIFTSKKSRRLITSALAHVPMIFNQSDLLVITCSVDAFSRDAEIKSIKQAVVKNDSKQKSPSESAVREFCGNSCHFKK